jgi:hypothetical protein
MSHVAPRQKEQCTMKKGLAMIALLALVIGVSSCGHAAPTPSPSPVPTGAAGEVAALVAFLRANGLTVQADGSVGPNYFSVAGQIWLVNSEQLQIFEYPDQDSALADAQQVSSNGGTIGDTVIDWSATPHFYTKDSIIVLYLGENQQILNLLVTELGPEFAGGTLTPVPLPTAYPPGTPVPYTAKPAEIITGQVKDVAASAEVITLAEPAAGVTAFALTSDTEILDAEGALHKLTDLLPGMTVEGSGLSGEFGTLIPDQVLMLTQPVATPITVIAWLPVAVGDSGLRVEVPRDWPQLGLEWVWTPAVPPGPQVGVNWEDITAGWEPTSMLPKDSEILRSEPVTFTWASTATRYTLKLTTPGATGYETDVVAQIGGQRAYDFSAFGSDLETMATLLPVLAHMLDSVQLVSSAGFGALPAPVALRPGT